MNDLSHSSAVESHSLIEEELQKTLTYTKCRFCCSSKISSFRGAQYIITFFLITQKTIL